MYWEDYILRIVTQAANAIARILGLKQAGQYQEALLQIDNAFEEFLGLSAELAAQLSADELLMTCRFGSALDRDKALLLARLLREEGDIYASKNRSIESHERYGKSLTIALEALLEGDVTHCQEHLDLVESLTAGLKQDEIGADLKYDLVRYYDKLGDRVKAMYYSRGW
jgi:hypothetical protein